MEPLNDNIRSMTSAEKVYVRFVNKTNRVIEIVWINFTGQYVKYQLLRKNSYIDINTYKTHPWIALDVNTRDRMCIAGSYVYMPKPKPVCQGEPNNPTTCFPIIPQEARDFALITLPLYSLRYCSLLAVRDLYKTVERIDNLELPSQLVTDLKSAIQLKERMVTTPIFSVT